MEATRAAWTELRTSYPNEHIYGFALYTTSEASYIAPTAYTEEGLAEVAARYAGESGGDPAKEAESLRFSPCDSPRHLLGESHFAAVERVLAKMSKNPARCIEACFDALSSLDAEGLFGQGSARESIVLNVLQGDQSNRSVVENARRLNPPGVLQWFEPHFEVRDNSEALFTLGDRGAYQIGGLALAGDTLAASGSGGELYVFRRDAGGNFHEIFGARSDAARWACALSPDGLTLYVSDASRLLARKVGTTKLGRAHVLLEVPKGPILELEVSPDGQTILLWSWDGLFAIDSKGSLLWTRPIVNRGLAWHPGGRRVAYADRTVVWLDPTSGEVVGEIAEIEGVGALAISADGSRLALSYGGGVMNDAPPVCCEVFELPSHQLVWRFEGTGLGDIRALAFSPRGEHLAAACTDGTVRVWDTAGRLVKVARSRHESMSQVRWLDEHRLVAAGRDVDEGPAVVAFALR